MYQVTSSKNLLIEKYSALNSQYEKSWHIVFKTVKKYIWLNLPVRLIVSDTSLLHFMRWAVAPSCDGKWGVRL